MCDWPSTEYSGCKGKVRADMDRSAYGHNQGSSYGQDHGQRQGATWRVCPDRRTGRQAQRSH